MILNMFPSRSQKCPQFPNVFPKTSPIAPCFFNLIVVKGAQREAWESILLFLGKHMLGSDVGGVLHVPKIFVMGQSNNFFSQNKKKKTTVGALFPN